MDINTQLILEVLDGDLDLLNDIINDVISEEYERDLFYNIEVYLKNSDFASLDKHIHKYRGSLAVFNVVPVNNILMQMRGNCVQKNLPAIEKLFESLKVQYSDFKESLILYKNKISK